MDTIEIVFIGAIAFTCIAFIVTLIYLFQPQNMRNSRLFSRKKKAPEPATTPFNKISNKPEFVATSLDTLSLKPILKPQELSNFNKLNFALRNKGVIVFPKMRFSEFIGIQKIVSGQDNEFYTILPYLIADYLICKSDNCKPICIVRDKNTPIESGYISHIQRICQKMNITLVEVDGIKDSTIAEIFQNIH